MEEEKIVYQDDQVKLTNLRLTCNHITVPVAKIDHVSTDLRVNHLSMAFVLFLLSFVFFYWYDMKICILAGIAMAAATLVWMISIYKSYVELWVYVNMRKIKILDTQLGNRSYIFKIADEIAKTLIIDKKLEEKHRQLEQKVGGFSPSETMKLRMLLKEMDKGKGPGITFEDEPGNEDQADENAAREKDAGDKKEDQQGGDR